MRVVAARFGDPAAARHVLEELRSRYELSREDAEIAPLGTPADAEDDRALVLAGRFYDERVGEVRRLVEHYGGQVVADIEEGATRPRRSSAPDVHRRRPRPGSQRRPTLLGILGQ